MEQNPTLSIFLGIESHAKEFQLESVCRGQYRLPTGETISIGHKVERILCGNSPVPFRLDNPSRMAALADLIDSSDTGQRAVAVKRIGTTTSGLSARFAVEVVQATWDSDTPKRKVLQFSLPLSQIQTIEGGEFAPVWLIESKLRDKQSSKWGGRNRSDNCVREETVPTLAKALPSPRSTALKGWLESVRKELIAEAEGLKREHAQDDERLRDEIGAEVQSEIDQFVAELAQDGEAPKRSQVIRFGAALRKRLAIKFSSQSAHGKVNSVVTRAIDGLMDRFCKPLSSQ